MNRIKLVDKPDRTDTLIEELTRVWEDSVRYGIETFAINRVTVNEQNPQAIGFYEHLGFKIYKRTETDEQGRTYQLLYMEL